MEFLFKASCRLLVLAVLLAGLLIGQTGSLWAHASLSNVQPADGTVVATPPTAFLLTFSEPVSPLALKLLRPDGSPLVLDRFTLRDRTVEIEAPAGLGAGTHVLTWRVVSEDGHPIGGSVIFSIGAVSAAPPAGDVTVDWTVRTGLWLSKILLYIGLFIGVGGVFARRAVMPGIAAGRRLVIAAIAVGTAGAILSAGLQGLDALGLSLERLGDTLAWSTAFGTTYGSTVAGALIAFIAATLALAATPRVALGAATVGLFAAAAALASSGHASAAAPQWLMRPAVFIHTAALGVWIGALGPLGLALRAKETQAAGALLRFSRIMPAVAATLALSGIVLAFVQVEKFSALTETAYGNVLLFKAGLLVAVAALIAINRWMLTARAGRGDPVAQRNLARSIAVETMLAVAVLGAVAAWRFTPPPRALAAAQPVETHIHTEKVMADLTITPGRSGPVTVAMFLMTGDFVALEPKAVTLVFSNADAGVEPFKREAARQGEGNWKTEGVVLPLPGTWDIRIDILISDFDLARLEGRVQIRD